MPLITRGTDGKDRANESLLGPDFLDVRTQVSAQLANGTSGGLTKDPERFSTFSFLTTHGTPEKPTRRSALLRVPLEGRLPAVFFQCMKVCVNYDGRHQQISKGEVKAVNDT